MVFAQSASLSLSWTAPTKNTDYTAVSDLAGYKIYLGRNAGTYSQTISVGRVTSYVLKGLQPDTTYYLRLSAIDSAGNESELTKEQVTRTFHAPLPEVIQTTQDDSDGDGLSNSYEIRYGTRTDRFDTDRDGVSDASEIAHGSDPLDRGSRLESNTSSGCARWNSALPGLWNIAELTNYSANTRELRTFGYGSQGSLFYQQSQNVAGFARQDVLAHEYVAASSSVEGNFCARAFGETGNFLGRMLYYLPEGNPHKHRQFQFALTQKFSAGRTGPQIVPVNMFHPGLGLGDVGKVTANWLHLANANGSTESGLLYIHNSSGQVLHVEELILAPYEVRSIALHGLGAQWYGSARWSPSRAVTRFQLSVARYFYDNAYAFPSFDTALQVEGKTATGQAQYLAVDTFGRSVVLEISNALGTDVAAYVYIDGVRETLVLPPYGSVHLPLDGHVAPSSLTRVVLRSDEPESLSATAVHYARTSDGGLRYAYALRATEPLAPSLEGAYNTNLSQSPWISMVTSRSQNVRVIARRSNGDTVADLSVPIQGTASLDLSQYESPGQTGTVTLIPEEPGTLAAWMLRVRPWEYVIPAELH